MGYMRHHTIVVASWSDEYIEKAHVVATAIFPWVSPISPEAINGYRAFFVPPDGSKEGWPQSDDGDRRRNTFVAALEAFRDPEDHGQYLDWVEVRMSDDNEELLIERSSVTEDPRNLPPGQPAVTSTDPRD